MTNKREEKKQILIYNADLYNLDKKTLVSLIKQRDKKIMYLRERIKTILTMRGIEDDTTRD